MMRTIATTVLLMCAAGTGVSALPPAYTLRLQGGSTLTPDGRITFLQLGGLGSYRHALESGGILSLRSSAAVSYLPAPIDLPGDSESLEVVLLMPAGRAEVTAAASLESSLLDPEFKPGWAVGVSLPLAARDTRWGVDYSGSYRWRQQAGERTLQHTLLTHLDIEEGIRRSWSLSLEGELEQAPLAAAIYDSFGLKLGGEVGGLIGFFTVWDIYLSTSYRGRPDDGSSILRQTVGGSIGTSPIRQISIDGGFDIEHSWYRPAGDQSLFTGGSIRLDYTPDDVVFLLIELGGGRTFADNPQLARWSSTAQVGVEINF